ncbi:hypothetical protein AMTRI_Chr10g3240 [Amborella trichopoda]
MEMEPQMMAALNQASSDIVHGMAKGAAARILVSERKALRFQQDLAATKEEALSMILRFKQAMVSKIAESERVSLGQRKRIQELEAQLKDANDTVSELRMKISSEGLGKISGPLDEQTSKGKAAQAKCNEEMLGTSVSYSLTLDSNTKVANFDPRITDGTLLCRNSTTETLLQDNSTVADCVHPNGPDFASIIMGNKEPELFKNGCTQRIRAYDQNFIVSKPGGNDNKCSHSLSDEMVLKEQGQIKPEVSVTSPSFQNPTPLMDLEKSVQSPEKGKARKFFRRVSSRRRKGRRNYVKSAHVGALFDQVEAVDETACPLPLKPSSSSQSNLIAFKDNLAQVVIKESAEDSASQSEKERDSVEEGKAEAPVMSIDDLVDRAENENCELLDNKILIDGKTNDSGIPTVDKSLMETKDLDVVCPVENQVPPKISEYHNEESIKPVEGGNDRVLKYTFRRKRKKKDFAIENEIILHERKSNSKKTRTTEKKCTLQVQPKARESSRDNRRLAQVARQLISLSEKKWG